MTDGEISPRSPDSARIETSAGGVVYRRMAGRIHYLLIRDRFGKWGLPKGHLEEGESAEQAALREIREETSLDALALGHPLRTIDWVFDGDGIRIHKYCHFFLVECTAGEPRPLDDEGIQACEWLAFDAAADRISYPNARTVLLDAAEKLGDAGVARRG